MPGKDSERQDGSSIVTCPIAAHSPERTGHC